MALFGLTKSLERRFDRIDKHIEQLAEAVSCLEKEQRVGTRELLKGQSSMGTQIEELNAKLQVVADTETVLGQSIQKVVDYLKNNPGDLTKPLGVLTGIADRLIATNASTLAHLPTTPEPVPDPLPEPQPDPQPDPQPPMPEPVPMPNTGERRR